MNYFKKYLVALLVFIIQAGFGQDKSLESIDNPLLLEEQVFIHHNSSFFLPGETLFYSFYNLNKRTYKKSEISKIGRVLLVDEKGNRVFTHVLNLEKGVSYSDFLIPSDVKTGVYKLIGYTNWMTNFEEPGVFEGNIYILNPYSTNSNLNFDKNDVNPEPVAQKATQELVKLVMNKKNYDVREQVKLNLESGGLDLEELDISISVRKIEDMISENPTRTSELEVKPSSGFNFKNFPEYRGRNIKGRVNNENGERVTEKLNLMYSVKDKPEKFRVISTNTNGSYDFQVSDLVDYRAAQLMFQKTGENYTIQPDSIEIDLSQIEFPQLNITDLNEEELKKRMVHHQVDRYYSSVKSDSIYSFPEGEIFYGSRGDQYLLDDYTRFKTMNETFIEVIQLVSFQGKKSDPHIIISSMENPNTTGGLPLVLLDGVPVSDHKMIYDLDPKTVESITVLEERYYYGPSFYQGLLDIRTIVPLETGFEAATEMKLRPSEGRKQYYSPVYNGTSNIDLKRVPDFRYQLLWLPEVSSNVVEFFTSDVPGDYEIRIEGFTKNGIPVSIREQFNVSGN